MRYGGGGGVGAATHSSAIPFYLRNSRTRIANTVRWSCARDETFHTESHQNHKGEVGAAARKCHKQYGETQGTLEFMTRKQFQRSVAVTHYGEGRLELCCKVLVLVCSECITRGFGKEIIIKLTFSWLFNYFTTILFPWEGDNKKEASSTTKTFVRGKMTNQNSLISQHKPISRFPRIILMLKHISYFFSIKSHFWSIS